MADEPDDDYEREERRDRMRRMGAQGGIATLVLALGIGGWIALNQPNDPTKRDASSSTIIPVEPPPPPPPPPEEPEPEEPEPEEQEVVEPEDAPPEPQAEAPPGPTIDGPAQAGGDGFGVRAGAAQRGPIVGGGGPARTAPGGAFAESGYNRLLQGVLQRAVQADERVNRRVFTAEVAVWIDPRGRITQASLLRTSGDDRVDQALVDRFQRLPLLETPPPASLRFPQRIQVRGRRA